jgi:hypothetical protein
MRHGGALNAYCCVKANLERLHNGWLQAYGILERQSFRDSKKIYGLQAMDGEMKKWSPWNFGGSEIILYDTRLDTFVKIHSLYNTKNET